MKQTGLKHGSSKRLVWVTDIHLNFVDTSTRIAYYDQICKEEPDALLVGGDISEADDLATYLQEMAQHLPFPIYFVLGNHDFYGSAFKPVRAMVRRLHERSQRLHWLPACGVVSLTEQTGLVGHGAWADGRLGLRSKVTLTDYYRIWDFQGLWKQDYFQKLNALGDAAADHFRAVLPEALQRFRHVVLLTHVPPFREAACDWRQLLRVRLLNESTWSGKVVVANQIGDVLLQRMPPVMFLVNVKLPPSSSNKVSDVPSAFTCPLNADPLKKSVTSGGS